jgi:hypothetical protein
MQVKNVGSALGEAIGKLIEEELERTLRPICESRGYIYDRGGQRPEKRKGIKLTMVNKSGNEYQLDAVIETANREPIILLESKYLRYKKHNRDKASWTCASHYSLRKSHPTIRKSIAVLSGNWSEPSRAFMQSFGIELYVVPFNLMCDVLGKFGVQFAWGEKEKVKPKQAWYAFKRLDDEDKRTIAQQLLNPIREGLTSSIEATLASGEDWAKRLKEVEILLKTNRNEYFTYSFQSSTEAIQYLLKLQDEALDLRGRL